MADLKFTDAGAGARRAVLGDKVFWSKRFTSRVTGRTVYVAEVFRECDCKRALANGVAEAKAKRLDKLAKVVCETEDEALKWLRSQTSI